VAKEYFSILRDLDMEFSPAKTHISKDFYEFAKRVFYQGSEITGFPVGALKSV
jgi:hypothetical protein